MHELSSGLYSLSKENTVNVGCNLDLESDTAWVFLPKDDNKTTTDHFSITGRKPPALVNCQETLPVSATKCGRQNLFANAINSSVSNS